MLGTPASSMARVISCASSELIARGFSQATHLPALAAAMAISLCVTFGLPMSIRSMSSRSIKRFQSVSTDS